MLDLDTGNVVSSGAAAFPCLFVVCAPGVYYHLDPVRKTLSFIVVESFDGYDLDLDGDTNDIILDIFSLTSGGSQLVKLWNGETEARSRRARRCRTISSAASWCSGA